MRIDDLKEMTYTQFIGTINQWNVPPGAFDTISRWGLFSQIDENSVILEVACTTGFSIRETVKRFNCQGIGIDICQDSINSAIDNKKCLPESKLDYICNDFLSYNFETKFSHIILGAALQFFKKPDLVIQKCIGLLEDGGFLLVSPFYINKSLPEHLIYEFEQIFGIKPTIAGYKDVMKYYKGLDIIYEQRKSIFEETDEELEHYCSSTTKRFCIDNSVNDKNIEDFIFSRLLEIKSMSNKLRKYQNYSVMVLKYKSEIYPKRFVELF